MKKTSIPKDTTGINEDMRPEYNFDYRKAKSNRFAAQQEEGRVSVTLDPDVSEVFQTPDSVNRVLRALIEAMPPSKPRRKKASA
jgi:hypothetical protein